MELCHVKMKMELSLSHVVPKNLYPIPVEN